MKHLQRQFVKQRPTYEYAEPKSRVLVAGLVEKEHLIKSLPEQLNLTENKKNDETMVQVSRENLIWNSIFMPISGMHLKNRGRSCKKELPTRLQEKENVTKSLEQQFAVPAEENNGEEMV